MLHWVVKQFEKRGSMHDISLDGCKCSTHVCAKDIVGASDEEVIRRKCMTFSTLYWAHNQHCMEICCDDLMFLHKMCCCEKVLLVDSSSVLNVIELF
jgi:hypothetical protein